MGVHDKAAVWSRSRDPAMEHPRRDVLLEGWRRSSNREYVCYQE